METQPYNEIADWFVRNRSPVLGADFLQRAMSLCPQGGMAIDLGCGCGQPLGVMLYDAGFELVGVDASEALLAKAQQQCPGAQWDLADMRQWQAPPACANLVLAWDSLFHLPATEHQDMITRMCSWLAPGGVLLFTVGGVDGECRSSMHGQEFYYASMDAMDYLTFCRACDVQLVVCERDQHPADHVVIMAQRMSTA